MSWGPDSQLLEQLRIVLRGTFSSNKNERVQSTETLQQAKLQGDLDNYLMFILVNDQESKVEVRTSAGVFLKNNLSKFDTKSPEVKQYILDNVLNGLLDKQNGIRNITGNVITSLFNQIGLKNWPQLLPNLMDLAEAKVGNELSQEGAIKALSKICEDSAHLLDQDFNGERPLNVIIPKFLNLLSSSSAIVKSQAIFCINQFIGLKTQSFLVHLDDFLLKLFELTNDSSDDVRRNVCSAFAMILDARPDKLVPHLDGVINYCLHTMKDSDEDVALEACEFLLSLATSSSMENIIVPKLSIILPILLEKMVYSEEDIFLMQLMDEKDDADVADRDEDIKPQMAKSRDAHTLKNTNGSSNAKASDSDYDDDDEDEDDDDMDMTEWNLRKCSAATLDVLASNLSADVLNVTIPILQDRIVSQEWPIREAAILAFGAISDGCLSLTRDKLSSLVPFLVDRLSDSEPRVRQITCWTLSRYSSWVCEEAHEGGQYANYFLPTFQAIMSCALDKKKVVQQAACSALEDFIDDADYDLLVMLIEPLLQHFNTCFQRYQRKNLIILFDTVQTFVEKVGDKVSENEAYINTLLPPLLNKWQTISDDDQDLWALLECMASVAASLGESFAPYAIPVYQRGLTILTNCIQLDKQCQTDPSIDAPEKDFIVTSLDLIDGLIQGFGSHSSDLIQQYNSEVNLMELVLITLDDHTDDVRQSAYALLGDLAIYVLEPIVKPFLHQIIISIGNEINNRSFDSSAVCNNATWALGEIALRLAHADIQPYIGNLIGVLIPLLNSSDVQPTVLENAAITIGRMGINSPTELSQHISEYLLTWSTHMRYLVENEEKETAFRGMCNVIAANPTGFGNTVQGKRSLGVFLECIGAYEEPTQELANLFQQLLFGYRAMFAGDWEAVLSHGDAEIRQALAARYGV